MSRFILKKPNKEKESLEYLQWLNDTIDRLISLDEPEGYMEKVEEYKEEEPPEYYVGLYEGVMATLRALDKSLYGDIEEFVELIDGTEAENIRHWEEYDPTSKQ